MSESSLHYGNVPESTSLAQEELTDSGGWAEIMASLV